MASGLYVRANIEDEVCLVVGIADDRTLASSRAVLQMFVVVIPHEASEGHDLLRVFKPTELGEWRRSAVRPALTSTHVLEEACGVAPEPIRESRGI